MAGKYYAVRTGKKPGIYLSWDACKAMVHGYPGAVYKSFQTRAEAEAFLNAGAGAVAAGAAAHAEAGIVAAGGNSGNAVAGTAAARNKTNNAAYSADKQGLPEVYAFVDGSYNAATGVYGYGGFLVHDGGKEVLQGAGDEPEMASMRNVAGEVLGSMAAVRKAVELGLTELTVYYDYMGIEMWATGAWKRNKAGTIAYHDYIASVREKIQLHFVKVKGHSGVEGNEEADRLAKEAVGNL